MLHIHKIASILADILVFALLITLIMVLWNIYYNTPECVDISTTPIIKEYRF